MAVVLIGVVLISLLHGIGVGLCAMWVGPTAESDALIMSRLTRAVVAALASFPLTTWLDRRWTAREAMRQLAKEP